MHSRTPYKFIHKVDDTNYGYGVSSNGMFVVAVAHEIPVKRKILWFDRATTDLETLNAMAIPTKVMGVISLLSASAPNDDETYPSDEDIVDDFRSLSKITADNLLHNNDIDQSEYNDAMWAFKKATILDDVSVFTDLKKSGWTHVASQRDYMMRHSYWVRSSRPNDCLSITDVKYFQGKKENDLTLISMEIVTLPFEFINKLNTLELGE